MKILVFIYKIKCSNETFLYNLYTCKTFEFACNVNEKMNFNKINATSLKICSMLTS